MQTVDMNVSRNIPFINTEGQPKRNILDRYSKEDELYLMRMNMALHKGEYSACFRKKKYSHHKAVSMKNSKYRMNKVIYPCPFCGEWHIGRNCDNILEEYDFKVSRELVLSINAKKGMLERLLNVFEGLSDEK